MPDLMGSMVSARVPSPLGSVRFGPFELRPVTGELLKEGVRLKISGQPLEILLILIVRAGEVISRDELRDSLWRSDTFVDFEHSLNAAVKRLRIALEDDVSSPQYIETVPRRGYRFIGKVFDSEGLGTKKADMHPRGPWQATGMQARRIPDGSPAKLRMRARDLKLKAERLSKEADRLFERADEIEGDS